MWYKSGTITVTNGSTTVTGSGTSWITGAGIGEALYAPDGRIYEIANIVSATQLTLGSAYLGTTASGQSYQIVPTQSYIRDLAQQAAQLVADYAGIASNAGAGKFSDGTLASPGIRFVSDEDTGFFRSGSNEVKFVAGGVEQFKFNSSGVSFPTGGTLVGASSTQTLTNKTISADNNTLSGLAASSFVVSNSSGNIDGSAAQKAIPAGVVVGTTDTQTLTNKTLSSPTVTGGTVNPATLQENSIAAVVQTDIGTAPNQIPLNQYLGSLAYEDADNIAGNVKIGGSLTVVSGVSISRTAVTAPAATDGNVFSGTYTPTLTNTTNVAASTAYICQYMRVGNVVTVSGQVAIDATATGLIVLEMSLPVASNFSQTRQAGGTFSAYTTGTAKEQGCISAQSTNDTLEFRAVVTEVANLSYFFSATYQVL